MLRRISVVMTSTGAPGLTFTSPVRMPPRSRAPHRLFAWAGGGRDDHRLARLDRPDGLELEVVEGERVAGGERLEQAVCGNARASGTGRPRPRASGVPRPPGTLPCPPGPRPTRLAGGGSGPPSWRHAYNSRRGGPGGPRKLFF